MICLDNYVESRGDFMNYDTTTTTTTTTTVNAISSNIISGYSSTIGSSIDIPNPTILYADLCSSYGNTNFDKPESKPKPKKTSTNLDIADYKIINDKVVIVTFKDGSTEKSVCYGDDVFDLERAIELCICKKKFGGNKDYYAAIRKALKQVRDIDTKKKKDAEEKERIANRKAKYAERKAKRMAKKRKAQIDLQTESFVAAMMKYNEIVNTAKDINAKASEDKAE